MYVASTGHGNTRQRNMANRKHNATAPATAGATATAQAAPATVLLTLGKPYNPKPNTKNGTGGCAGTWALLVAHLNANGPSTYAQLRAVALANGDPGFVGYCQQHGRLVPAKPPQA
jgi:hypothetical protein